MYVRPKCNLYIEVQKCLVNKKIRYGQKTVADDIIVGCFWPISQFFVYQKLLDLKLHMVLTNLHANFEG